MSESHENTPDYEGFVLVLLLVVGLIFMGPRCELVVQTTSEGTRIGFETPETPGETK